MIIMLVRKILVMKILVVIMISFLAMMAMLAQMRLAIRSLDVNPRSMSVKITIIVRIIFVLALMVAYSL
jgi:hypothetical protein